MTEKMNFSQNSAPDCRRCKHYWNNREDPRYIDTAIYGYSATYREFDGEEYSGVSVEKIKFKHGCKYFDVETPSGNLPSLFIFTTVGKHCPIVIAAPAINNEKNNVSEDDSLAEKHGIDIRI
jgi:hypothetical protein